MQMDMTADSHPKPLVVGLPRSGFTLLISVIDACRHFHGLGSQAQNPVGKALISALGQGVANTIEEGFAKAGLKKRLVFSPSFRTVLGGPHWIDVRDTGYFCYRKYIGVKGYGDFSLLIRFPWTVNCTYPIEHSHSHPLSWLSDSRFKRHIFFASIRNPLDIVSSSCFSINAISSEYIQSFMSPRKDNDILRQSLAYRKLTDLQFFRGLIKHVRNYCLEYLNCRDHFYEMRWEDLIGVPGRTIKSIAERLNLSMDDSDAAEIWETLAYKNLTGPHRHNYRSGEAFVNGWRKSLTNRHLTVMKEEGLEEISLRLGYGKFLRFNENNYTPFQEKTDQYLRKGKLCKGIRNKDLSQFAFNKSNIDASLFPQFKSYPWKNHTRVEQSCFRDERILESVWLSLDNIVTEFNALLCALGDFSIVDKQPKYQLDRFLDKYPRLLAAAGFDSTEECRNHILEASSEKAPPRLIKAIGNINIVLFHNRFYSIPQSLGPMDLSVDSPDKYDAIQSDETLDNLLKRMST